MDWVRQRFERIAGAENFDHYALGGLRPVLLGEEFKEGRYTIVNKLGYGRDSTVWLAKDDVSGADDHVAFKIYRADHPLSENWISDISAARTYNESMELLRQASDANKQYVLLPHSDSLTTGCPNGIRDVPGDGIHHVQVYPVAGPSIGDRTRVAKDYHLDITQAKRAIPQIALGLQFMHSHGIGHGDLHSDNILEQVHETDLPLLTELFRTFAQTRNPKLLEGQPPGPRYWGGGCGEAGVPAYAVLAMTPLLLDKLPTCRSVAIADMGAMFKSPAQDKPGKRKCKVTNCAPERLMGLEYGLPSDIWSLGCLIFEILFGRELFSLMAQTPDTCVLVEMIKRLGWPPNSLHQSWKQAQSSDSLGTPSGKRFFYDIRETIETMRNGDAALNVPERLEDFSEEEISQLTDLLCSMVQYEPAARPTIAKVLDHPWMQSLRDCECPVTQSREEESFDEDTSEDDEDTSMDEAMLDGCHTFPVHG
ncbi:hypothetical protein LTR56_021149 [Elasticomyces elasticus]|nr:hypothetical protein LTR56_021149 [Elasticomyces elasticus]KAK3631824.1 hypothetical protein LTR22_020892 [Elasticomyces elasticus]KAK4909680.1 hypothetical protein LTR49_021574 [Elasticomyces elasticus]KAK5749542.1 hypothetical protein LTS12_020408 [Elasticomyces elasticus]